jgi:hypothetical protein
VYVCVRGHDTHRLQMLAMTALRVARAVCELRFLLPRTATGSIDLLSTLAFDASTWQMLQTSVMPLFAQASRGGRGVRT